MDTESAIRAESLTKVYRSGGGTVIVFDALNLSVPRGERLAIVGESGAGKSTLLHLLGGLDKPTSGTVRYSGAKAERSRLRAAKEERNRSLQAASAYPSCAGHLEDIELNRLNDQALADFRNQHLGFVWQNPSLLPEFTALENVMMPLLIRGVDPDGARRKAQERLAEVGLAERGWHRAGELSGGEQQRVALARALVTEPKVLLADEPTGSVDFRTSKTIFALLNEMHERHSLTSVFVTHNLSFAERCDRVLELDKGRLRPLSTELSIMDSQGAEVAKDATRLNGGKYV